MNKSIKKFEDIIAWQKARKLSLCIYKLFQNNKDFSFKDQICRASISVSNNIAEGFERRSSKEFRAFLYIAKASCGEVRSMLYIALDLEYINEHNFDKLIELSTETSRLIYGFIRNLE